MQNTFKLDVEEDVSLIHTYKQLLNMIWKYPKLGIIEFWRMQGTVKSKICWSEVSSEKGITPYFAYLFRDKVDWAAISLRSDFSLDFFRECKEYTDWAFLAFGGRPLPEDFIEEFADVLNWNSLSHKQDLSDSFIEKHVDKVSPFFLESNVFLQKRNYDLTMLFERGDYGMWRVKS